MICKLFWLLRALFYKPFFGKMGRMSYIGKPTYLGNMKRIFVGNKVRIFPGARIEVVSKTSSIHFQDNIAIGQNLHITSGGTLIIGKNTTMAGNVTITNIDHDYRMINVSIIDQPLLISETEIGENCYIGKGVMIQAGTKLGIQCIVGANAVVRGSFPDYCVIVGNPGKVVKKYDHETNSWLKVDS